MYLVFDTSDDENKIRNLQLQHGSLCFTLLFFSLLVLYVHRLFASFHCVLAHHRGCPLFLPKSARFTPPSSTLDCFGRNTLSCQDFASWPCGGYLAG